jgi:hypothetical protein
MNASMIEKRTATTASKEAEWRERIAEQQRSGISVKRFCRERGLTEYSFYSWRKRLQNQGPVRFALVETGPAERQAATDAGLELVLATGERLRINVGVNPTVLRTVLEVLRG